MRKILAMALVLVLALGAACACAESVTGGWKAAEDSAVTEERQALFDKGMEGLLGVSYTPVAYLGSQVVAGTNHAFLCRAAAVAPDAVPSWKIVFLYEDLKGGVSILNIADFDFGALCTYGAKE